MTAPSVVIEFRKKEQPGEYDGKVLHSPSGEFKPWKSTAHYQKQIEREAIARALGAYSFELTDWEEHPGELTALKELELADDNGFKNVDEMVGNVLFNMMSPEVQVALTAAIDLNQDHRRPVRVELRFWSEDTDLATYPWELLHEQGGHGFLFDKARATLSRYITCKIKPPDLDLLEADTPLILLLVSPRPSGLEPLNDSESQAIRGVLATAEKGLFHLKTLPRTPEERCTRQQLEDYLDNQETKDLPHIIHFDGHGGFGRICPMCNRLRKPADGDTCCGKTLPGEPMGYLAFEKGDKSPDYISSRDLGRLLADKGIRLVVLSACKSAVMSGSSVFSGTAPALIQVGVPAVVAMQFAIEVKAACKFFQNFYKSLAKHDPLTSAMCRSRAHSGTRDWYRPVLYLRADDSNRDGSLFRPPDREWIRREMRRTCTELEALHSEKLKHDQFSELWKSYDMSFGAIQVAKATELEDQLWDFLRKDEKRAAISSIVDHLLPQERHMDPAARDWLRTVKRLDSDLTQAVEDKSWTALTEVKQKLQDAFSQPPKKLGSGLSALVIGRQMQNGLADLREAYASVTLQAQIADVEEARQGVLESFEPSSEYLIDEIDDLLGLATTRDGWVGSLEELKSDLPTAIEGKDCKALLNVKGRLRHVLDFWSNKIDERMKDKVMNLNLQELVNGIETIAQSSTNPGGTSKFETNSGELSRFAMRLERFRDLHAAFQIIQNQMSSIALCKESLPSAVRSNWDCIREQFQLIHDQGLFQEAVARDRMDDLFRLAGEIESALLNHEDVTIRNRYPGFSSKFRFAFDDVDKEMIKLCTDMDGCGVDIINDLEAMP